MTPEERRAQVLGDLESHRHQLGEPELEAERSIKDWIDLLPPLAKQAMALARSGQAQAEYDTWVQVAAVACARAEDLLRVIDGEEERVLEEAPPDATFS